MILKLYLVVPEKVCPRRWDKEDHTLSSYRNHVRNCPLNKHEVILQHNTPFEYSCVGPFRDDAKVYHRLEPSRLELLLTSHEMFGMAVRIFYRQNHFVFEGKYQMAHLKYFLDGIGDRQQYLSELSFQYAQSFAVPVFKTLSQLQNLTKLHVIMDIEYVPVSAMMKKRGTEEHGVFYPTLANAPGVAHMLNIRNLKVLEISGWDTIDNGTNNGQLVNVRHELAIGAKMMKEMLSAEAYASLSAA